MDDQCGWYFTAPWDPVPIRRGDALGFRAGNPCEEGLFSRRGKRDVQ